MRILFTGGSSFTGLWLARSLAQAGHNVVTTFTRNQREEYGEGLRCRRLDLLLAEPRISPAWAAPFGSEKFIDLIMQGGPWDILCIHGAVATDYKSAAFDVLHAVDSNTRNLARGLDVFSKSGGQAVVATGTYFEADEGAGTEPQEAFSPYGLSKTLTWHVFRYWCQVSGLRLGKYVLPNPIGPLEEPRFPAYLIHSWLRGENPVVQTPAYVRDNAPIPYLAEVYVDFVEKIIQCNLPRDHCSPSGWVETVGEFAQRLAGEMAPRLGVKCSFELTEQRIFLEPLDRHNFYTVSRLTDAPWLSDFWDQYAAFYQSTVNERY